MSDDRSGQHEGSEVPPRRGTATFIISLIAVVIVILIAPKMLINSNIRRSGQIAEPGVTGMTAYRDELKFASLSEWVENSPVIVVATYVGTSYAGMSLLPTPIVDPAVINGMPLPEESVQHSSTELEIEQIIKNDGSITQSGTVRYASFGPLPTTESDVIENATSIFPFRWPQGTRFLLFLAKNPPTVMAMMPSGLSPYVVTLGTACGRVLDRASVDETGVSCSDAERSVLPFMNGLTFQQFVDAVIAEVAAQPTPTP